MGAERRQKNIPTERDEAYKNLLLRRLSLEQIRDLSFILENMEPDTYLAYRVLRKISEEESLVDLSKSDPFYVIGINRKFPADVRQQHLAAANILGKALQIDSVDISGGVFFELIRLSLKTPHKELVEEVGFTVQTVQQYFVNQRLITINDATWKPTDRFKDLVNNQTRSNQD